MDIIKKIWDYIKLHIKMLNSKDWQIVAFVTLCGIIGGILPLAFEWRNWFLVALCDLIGAGAMTAFVASRAPRSAEEKLPLSQMYACGIGAVISLIISTMLLIIT